MIPRQILTSLQEWKTSPRRKPLVLRGARQVGKSTVVDMLGETFDNYLSFNLENATYRDLFERNISVDDLVISLFAVKDKAKLPGDTLIFIDEVQNSPIAMSKVRYFKEERPDLHVITAGSMLENVVDVQASFPVGRVEYMAMRPLSFYEFMNGMGHKEWSYFIQNPEQCIPMHSELMTLFNQYVIVGGMPEVVADFVVNRDIKALEPLYEALIQGYRDDVEKYVRGKKLTEVVRFVIDSCWSKVGEKVTLGGFGGSSYKAREIGEACRLLGKAILLELAYPTSATSVPALPEETRMPKLFMLDTGLANYKSGVRRELIGAKDIMDVWRGRIAEQVVAQELLTLNHKVSQTRSFWSKLKDLAEVDFVLNWESQLVPIEVKNGHNAHLSSLHQFMETAPINIGVRVWSQPFSVDDIKTRDSHRPFRLINLPFYMVGNIEAVLSQYA